MMGTETIVIPQNEHGYCVREEWETDFFQFCGAI